MNSDRQEPSDADLVAQSLADPDRYSVLVSRYEDKLRRYLRRITGLRPEEVDELLQEVFLKTYLNLNAFRQHQSFSAWIYRIARNEAISEYRRRQARPEGHMNTLDEDAAERLATHLRAESEAERSVLASSIERVLERMDPKYRDVLVLRFLEDRSYEEIAYILRRPPGTVATLLNRAKTHFRKEAQQIGIHFEL